MTSTTLGRGESSPRPAVCDAAPIAGAGAGLPGLILGTIVCWLVATVSEERLAGNRVGRPSGGE
jgi:hypothetical protein